MSSSTIPNPISSIFLLFLISNITVTSSSNPLIEQVCSESRLGSKHKLCIQILESQPKIISAKNLHDLALAIMQSGISNATNTSTYIKNLLKGSMSTQPDLKLSLQDCKSAYDQIISSFIIGSHDCIDKEYDAVSYGLLTARTDGFKSCLDDVAVGKIKDGTILSGNNVTLIYAFSANEAVDIISRESHQIN
ncbi:hypothetical protein CASFOL_016068 [Castilleja foliolosa]|uniref:Pectinesterase inhibitor domain-containing protein n=1 Tax=Castilleja foliolosa TaxID=1961234 RepID=A0ABD3DFI3_9LAMI